MASDRSPHAGPRSAATATATVTASATAGVAVEDLPRLARTPGVVILDVRPRRSFRRAHVPGSHSIPAGLLLASELPEGELLLVGADSAQTEALIDQLHAQGYSRAIRYLRDGFAAWRAAHPASAGRSWSLGRLWFGPGAEAPHDGWSVARSRA